MYGLRGLREGVSQNDYRTAQEVAEEPRWCVSCVSKDKGAVVMKACKAGCIGCGKCQKVCAFGAITIENNLAYIDPQKCKLCRKCVNECPTGAIVLAGMDPLPKAPKAPAAPESRTCGREGGSCGSPGCQGPEVRRCCARRCEGNRTGA